MKINQLIKCTQFSNPKIQHTYNQFQNLIELLNDKNINSVLISKINIEIDYINDSISTGNNYVNLLKAKQTDIIKMVEKDTKIVPRKYYSNLWTSLGMTTFGLPIGTAIGLSLGNIGLMAIGLPIGLVIGKIVGTNMDKKAEKEGRQLDIEIK